MNDTHRAGIEPWFGHTVGLLLLTVVAGLTGLSLKLYQRARLAEQVAGQSKSDLDEQAAMWALLSKNIDALAVPLEREALPTRETQLDGQSVTVLTATPEQGRAVGLRPGDVLVVSPEVTSSSAPARPGTVVQTGD